MRPLARRPRAGLTMIELIVVLTLIGTLSAMVLPKLRTSPLQHLQGTGMQISQDLEMVRTRALAVRRPARVVFDPTARTYVAHVSVAADGAITESAAEVAAFGAFRSRLLGENVAFGRGAVPKIPGDTASGDITFAMNRLNLSARGVTNPFGTRGVIYLRHTQDAASAAAVAVSAAGSVRLWLYRGGAWQ